MLGRVLNSLDAVSLLDLEKRRLGNCIPQRSADAVPFCDLGGCGDSPIFSCFSLMALRERAAAGTEAQRRTQYKTLRHSCVTIPAKLSVTH